MTRRAPVGAVVVSLTFLLGEASFVPRAQAQALQEGSIVALKSPQGHWLAATPSGVLYMSPNAAPSAWEEWRYTTVRGHPTYISFHGTGVIYTPSGGYGSLPKNVHSAIGAWSTPISTRDTWDASGAASGGPQLGGSIGVVLYPQEFNQFYTLNESGGQPVWTAHNKREVWPTNPDAPGWGRFKVVGIPSPSAGRKPLQTAIDAMYPVHLKSTHGTFPMYDGKTYSAAAVHLTQEFALPTMAYDYRTDVTTPITYGSAVLFRFPNAQGYATLQPNDATNNAAIQYYLVTDAEKWTVIDPYGVAGAGMGVPFGAPICLRSKSGKLLSAVPTSSPFVLPKLKLSTNTCSPTTTWEHWTVLPSPSSPTLK